MKLLPHTRRVVFRLCALLALPLSAGTNAQNVAVSHYGYAGHEPDANGLSFARTRYYDSGTGRYTQRDSIGLDGGIDDYAYVLADPVDWIDRDGTFRSEYHPPNNMNAAQGRILQVLRDFGPVGTTAYGLQTVAVEAGMVGGDLVPLVAASTVTAGVWLAAEAPVTLFLSRELLQTYRWSFPIALFGARPSYQYLYRAIANIRALQRLEEPLQQQLAILERIPLGVDVPERMARLRRSIGVLEKNIADSKQIRDEALRATARQGLSGLSVSFSGLGLGLWWRRGLVQRPSVP